MLDFDAEHPERIPLVYLAGPYTAPDPCENTHNTLLAANHLWNSNLVVPVVPHLSHFWHTVTPKPYAEWTRYDLHLLRVCDAVFRLPGDSPGADAELDEARKLAMPIFYELSDLNQWARERLAEYDRIHGRSILRDA